MTVKHLTAQEFADRVQVPLATVYRWNSAGDGPPYLKAGRHVRYRIKDIETWESARSIGES